MKSNRVKHLFDLDHCNVEICESYLTEWHPFSYTSSPIQYTIIIMQVSYAAHQETPYLHETKYVNYDMF